MVPLQAGRLYTLRGLKPAARSESFGIRGLIAAAAAENDGVCDSRPLWASGRNTTHKFPAIVKASSALRTIRLGLNIEPRMNWFKRKSAEEKQRDREVRDAKSRLKAARRTRVKAIVKAEKLRNRAEKEHEKLIKKAAGAVGALTDQRGVRRNLIPFHGVQVFERYIVTPHGSGSIIGCHAYVDTAGNVAIKSRATLTRMGAGAVVAGPLGAVLSLGFKKHQTVDSRVFYLVIESPEVSSFVMVGPDKSNKAFEIAALINNTAKQAAAFEPHRPGAITQASERLEATRSDTKTLDEAFLEYERLKNDPELLRPIDQAKEDLARLGVDVSGEREEFPADVGECEHPPDQLAPITQERGAFQRYACRVCGAIVEARPRLEGDGYEWVLIRAGKTDQ